jgi:hypothetical protein
VGGPFGRPATYTQTEEHQVQRGVDFRYAIARRRAGKSGERNTSLSCFSHGRPDGHNGTPALSRSLNPGKFGYSTFGYLVRYSCKRDARTSLFRPYQSSLLSRILPLFKKARLDWWSDAKGWDRVFRNREIFSIIARQRPSGSGEVTENATLQAPRRAPREFDR